MTKYLNILLDFEEVRKLRPNKKIKTLIKEYSKCFSKEDREEIQNVLLEAYNIK